MLLVSWVSSPTSPLSVKQIRHYCHTSTKLMMALPSSLNPILSIHLPIILSMPETTSLSPTTFTGTVPWEMPEAVDQPVRASVEALRLSLLGIASIHKSFTFAKSGPENREKAKAMWDVASRLRYMATSWLNLAVSHPEGAKSDAALGACVSIALIDVSSLFVGDVCDGDADGIGSQIFAGGHNYKGNLEIGKRIVALRGGPSAMVRFSKPDKYRDDPDSPSLEGPAHFVETGPGSPKKTGTTSKRGVWISSARLLLEILTVYETFSESTAPLVAGRLCLPLRVTGSLTSGEPTTLLTPGDSAWWFEGDRMNYHLLSIEKVFGMSRSIVELFARVSNFLNRHLPRRERGYSRGNVEVVQGHLTPRASRASTPVPSLSSLRESPPPANSPLAPLHAEACALLREVGSWQGSANDPSSLLLTHPRVQYGNKAHKCALIILLLREAFNIPPNDGRVQRCVSMALSAAVAASGDFVMSVDLTWPVIIAGCQCTNQQMPMRSLTVTALEGFRWVLWPRSKCRDSLNV